MEVAVKMAAMVVGRTAPLWRLNVGRLAIRKPRDAGVYCERRLPRRRRQHRLRHQPPSRRLVHVAIRDADHMFHASKPPATTYARRKSRSKPQEPSRDAHQSSPLQELPADAQDVTILEMSRRMKKRSRLVLSASQEASERNIAEPVLKKSKSTGTHDVQSSRDSAPATPALTADALLLPLEATQIDDSIFTTPDIPVKKLVVPGEVEPSTIQDPLSPIPVARRMLSRTSSRNLKENSRRNLASPFHSRPGSRPASPFHATRRADRAAHAKTRTLSSDLKKRKPIPVDRTTQHDHDSILDTTYNTSAPMSVSYTTHHARTTSIPAITASVLDGIAPEDWLVPPKALSRSPSAALLEDIELDTFQAEHPSFYFDVPAKASTPPRKRSATVTQASYKIQQCALSETVPPLQEPPGSDSDRMVLDEDVVVERQSRRRRRTMIHMSSDSIFSSALDFSAYQTGDSFTKQHSVTPGTMTNPPGTESIPLVAAVDVVSTLDPAFSPFHGPAVELREVDVASVPASQVQQLSSTMSSASIYPPPALRRSYSQPITSVSHANADSLHEAFTQLKLNGSSFRAAYIRAR